MNKWLGIIIAVLAVIGAFFIGQIMHPLSNFNPVGFHAQGQVQINGTNTLDVSSCTATSTKPCTLTFDFALDPKNTPTAQPCDNGTKCLSFSNAQGQTMQVMASDSSTTPTKTYNDYVSGRVVVAP